MPAGRMSARRLRLSPLWLLPVAVCLGGCQTDRGGVYINVSAAMRAYRDRVDRKPDRAQMERLVSQLPAEQLTDMGVMYERERRFDDAAWAYQRAIWRDPRCARAYLNLGNVLRQQGKLEEARFRYRQAMAADPNSVEAVNNFADVAATDGTGLDEAIARLAPVVEKAGPLRPYTLDTLGWLHHRKGEEETARQLLTTALAAAGTSQRELLPTIHAHLAVVCRALGRMQEAEKHEAEARPSGGG